MHKDHLEEVSLNSCKIKSNLFRRIAMHRTI